MQRELPFEVPCIVNGKPVRLLHLSVSSASSDLARLHILFSFVHIQVKTGKLAKQPIPSDHAKHLCTYHEADEATIASAIEGALAAKEEWENMPWNDRAAIFLKAADLVSKKYRYKLMAATILGQGKNAWQAEIDAAAEVRFVFSCHWKNGV